MEIRITVGETISKIQKSKNIKIKDICKDFFSESTYFRIVNNEIETSITNFNHIIEKLNVTYDEFFFLCNQQTWQINEGLMHDIKVAYLKKDDLTLKAVREKMETMNQNSKIVHLQWLCDALINRLKSIHVSSSENKLVHYLLEIEEWTRYEIVLFNNSIFSFDIDIVNILVQKIIKKNYSYNLYKNNNRELFQLLINVTACNIQNSDFKKAKRIFNSAKELFLEEDALFEKNILLFWTGFFEAYNGEVEGKAKIKESLNIFHLLNSTNLFRMHKDLYDSFFIFE